VEAFEIVWRAVKDNHFDPTFGGVDWDAVREEFAPRIRAAASDREAHALLQQMLNSLGQSHFNIITPESIPSTEDEDEADEDADADANAQPKPRPAGSLEMAERLTNGIGIDLRIVSGAVVVTRVEPQSPAERAGLRTGFVLRSIDGYRVTNILRMLRRAAVYQPAVRSQIPAEILVGFVNGPAGTSVRLTYLDALNRVRRVTMARERLRGEMSPTIPTMPSQFVEFESKRLRRGRVGYIRFNLFLLPVLEKFCAALRSMKDANGVVIDLRGNRGGLLGLIYGLGGLLETREVSFGVMRTRAGAFEFRVRPQRSAYRGQVVVLIDSATLSAGEIFAGGLQESGRALLVGERSAGATLPSVAKPLPTGAILQYAFADFVTSNGHVLEGSGVLPDIPVKLDRRSLLAGRDPQLEAALDAIETSAVNTPPASPPPPAPFTVRKADAGPSVVVDDSKATPTGAIDPQVEPIIERYVEAVGGRAAFERLSTRVSKGTFKGSFAGVEISGAVEVFEKAPDKSVTVISVNGLGHMRRGFTGAYAYEQIPLFGFRLIEGSELAEVRRASDFFWPLDLKRLYTAMTLKGKEKSGDAELFVVEAVPAEGNAATLYFDARTGLLVRRDKTYFEDYREVDGVKLPFTVRDEFSTTTFTEVKHNVPVTDAQFLEERDCFTQ
jgi:carboxyl-terminal processing protease